MLKITLKVLSSHAGTINANLLWSQNTLKKNKKMFMESNFLNCLLFSKYCHTGMLAFLNQIKSKTFYNKKGLKSLPTIQ